MKHHSNSSISAMHHPVIPALRQRSGRGHYSINDCLVMRFWEMTRVFNKSLNQPFNQPRSNLNLEANHENCTYWRRG